MALPVIWQFMLLQFYLIFILLLVYWANVWSGAMYATRPSIIDRLRSMATVISFTAFVLSRCVRRAFKVKT